MFWQWTMWQIETGLNSIPDNYRGLIMLVDHGVMMERLGWDIEISEI